MENSGKRNSHLIADRCDAESLGYGLRRRNSGEEDEGTSGRHRARFCHIAVESGKIGNRPNKRMKCKNAEGPNVSVEVAGTININECKMKRVTVADQNQQQYDDFRVSKPSPLQNSFSVGDIVWARSDSRIDMPAWPAQVIDPVQDAPQSLQNVWVRQRHCVRFFCMKRSWDCEYAWVKEEMMFPFWESFGILSYEGQILLERGSKHLKGEFLEAIKEAYVAEAYVIKDHNRHQLEETTCSSCSKKFPASKLLESVKAKELGNSSNNGGLICPRCYNLYECNQYCGICKKVWNPTLKRNWVQCEKCEIWVHADCDNLSREQLQDRIEYSCPHCTLEQPALRTAPIEENNSLFTYPERITGVSDGKEEKNNRPLAVPECIALALRTAPMEENNSLFTSPERITGVSDGKEEKSNRPFVVPECIAVVCDGKEEKNNKPVAVREGIAAVCDGKEKKKNRPLDVPERIHPKRIAVVCDGKEEKINRPFAVPEGISVVCDGKEKKTKRPFDIPDCITVVCNGREGHYVTNRHLILCECSECGNGTLMSLSRWERHVGCKRKKWKESVKVRVSNQHLIHWLNNAHDAGACGLGFFKPDVGAERMEYDIDAGRVN